MLKNTMHNHKMALTCLERGEYQRNGTWLSSTVWQNKLNPEVWNQQIDL